MDDTFRCAASSAADHEPLVGTAPTDTSWLFVEQPGAWGRQAVSGSGLPDDVVAHLDALPARVQLVRRPGRRAPGSTSGGVRVVSASLHPTVVVRSVVLDDVRDVVDLAATDLAPHDQPLWLVCTHGRRDVCCAERGRPVAAALAGVDADATWETTHLGGHRFAATLLALPSGLALGRLDDVSALVAAREIGHGRRPDGVVRGRAGWPAAAQVADDHVRGLHAWTGLDDVTLTGVRDGRVTLATPAGPAVVTVSDRPGGSRRQSCADLAEKDVRTLGVEQVTMAR